MKTENEFSFYDKMFYISYWLVKRPMRRLFFGCRKVIFTVDAFEVVALSEGAEPGIQAVEQYGRLLAYTP